MLEFGNWTDTFLFGYDNTQSRRGGMPRSTDLYHRNSIYITIEGKYVL